MKIEKSISPPPKRHGERKSYAPTFEQMEIGDSIFIDGEQAGLSAAVSAHRWFKSRGMESTRVKESGGYRIWRMS